MEMTADMGRGYNNAEKEQETRSSIRRTSN